MITDPGLSSERLIPLTKGLFRNTIFNVIGWLWPVALSLVTVPIILKGLGTDSYGVFGLVSIASGYIGLLNSPMAFGNIRFMAEAYGHQDWDEFFRYALSGFWISVILAGITSLLLFSIAGILVHVVFKIPDQLIPESIAAFQLAALSFFLNGVAISLKGIPTAIRRYDIQNMVGMAIGTINILGIVGAILLGWGLIGAIWAQVLSSLLAVIAFSFIAWRFLKGLNPRNFRFLPDRFAIKRIVNYSILLFGGQGISWIGLQADRTIVGILMGPSAVTYYTVPAKITDNIAGLIERLVIALYPLSAESTATSRLEELKKLYLPALRYIFLVITYIATILAILSKEILVVWVGPDLATKSAIVLTLLALAQIPRCAGGISSNVLNGLGRADFNILIGLVTFVCNVLPVVLLTPKYGLVGAAIGMLIGLLIANFLSDILTQRKFLRILDWRSSLKPYAQFFFIVMAIVGISFLIRFEMPGWGGILVKFITFSFIYLFLALICRLATIKDFLILEAKFKTSLNRILTHNIN